MATDTYKETLSFQTEVKRLLDLMIHSLYSNKEIFLRELISNASDAIDRLRFDALSNSALYEHDTDFRIHVSYDKEARTVTIADNGIGMSRADVIENLGTIAKSGTQEFFQSLTGDQKKDANIIGQFGVGFYSSFVVADSIKVVTRHAASPIEEGVCWESTGQGEYTLEMLTKTDRGTEVTLHLREGENEFLNGHQLRTIIRKYSDHIMLPIVMRVENAGKIEDSEVVDDTEKVEEEVVNSASALWMRAKSEIKPEEYNQFYKHVSHDFSDPLVYVHSRMEGIQEYTILLYVPSQAPYDLWSREYYHGVKLYVRRVFIMDDAEKLMPRYLRFIRGVIDSNDLPLNVSREILQQSKMIDTIRSSSIKKVLGLLTDLATNDKEKYASFWSEFGRVLKEGLLEDHSNRKTLTKLLRFSTTISDSETQSVSLEEYVAQMKENQDKIYYIVADNYAAAKGSPLLEIFKKKGIEVLFLTDPVDHIALPEIREFEGKQLQSVSKGEVDLSKFEGEQEKEEQQKSADEAKDLLIHLKEVLGDKVKDVRTTTRLTSSPACLVTDEYGIDPSLKRLLHSAGQTVPNDKPILEINPQHPIVTRIKDESNEQLFGDWANVLLDQSVLSSGEQLDNPISFVNRLNGLLTQL